MEVLNQILNALNSVPAEVWGQVGEIVVSAVIVSPLALALKKWWKVNSEKIMVVMVMVGSILAAILAYLQTQPEFAPYFVAVQGALVFATTQPVYYFFVKPVWTRLVGWFETQVERAAELNDTKSAEVPSNGLPLSNEQNKNT